MGVVVERRNGGHLVVLELPFLTCPELFSSAFIRRQCGMNPMRQPLAQIARVSVGSESSSLYVCAA